MIATKAKPIQERQIVAATLRTCIRLPASQRSSVILSDVLGDRGRERPRGQGSTPARTQPPAHSCHRARRCSCSSPGLA
jgi:hypothetical protein